MTKKAATKMPANGMPMMPIGMKKADMKADMMEANGAPMAAPKKASMPPGLAKYLANKKK